jgi:16S rRNA (uracil1498-N3)-methyltransferase
VKTFTPLQAERAVAGIPNERRRERYAEVVREAAEQSGRGQLPVIMPTLSLAQAVGQVRGLGLFLWEEASAHHSLNTVLRNHAGAEITLFIGPEGGFSQREAQLAAQAGLHIITLGPRVLRAETAAIVASALVLGTLGELG